jgi:molybdopterin-guanine dinucleotide biosynthesis protein A
MYGVLFVAAGLVAYCFGVLLSIPRILFGLHGLLPFNEAVVWYSGAPVLLGIVLGALDLFVLLPGKRSDRPVMDAPLSTEQVTVTLTAYNDQESIEASVKDFLAHPKVARVIVVDNNSKDATAQRARDAGATVVVEEKPGYGQCVYRCLSEGLRYDDTEVTVLCEGDMTFRAADLDKLLSYARHADVVNGTRIVEQLRQRHTQLSTFMYYGNFAVGKLLEIKHLGRGTFTDVGTTYKLCRNVALRRLLPILRPEINLEFNAYFLDTALGSGERLVECPITFWPRVGVSKGGNVNNSRALQVGLRMLRGLVFGWPEGNTK